ncbi:protein kinase C and casein kinase substrate in neurons protein 2-like isoform X1 [Mytilus edulis]|uniref:protein kinase C and casein kinase substrate in neurons protein 2-like isoform X1 n=1 Tax=Mytilus edulis TaxID=6550 RepID=UPI0039EF690B
MAMQKAEALPFLTVEEAIRRSKQTLRFQEELSLSIWERARIELVYIRNLKEWMVSTGSKLTPILEKAKDFTDEMVLKNLVKEALCTTEVHQNVHNAMMCSGGPYSTLQRGIGLNKITKSSEERLLSDVEKEFYMFNRKRVQYESDIQKKKVSTEKMKSTIIELEEQLSKRSRIAHVRRSTRSNRKVDNLSNRLSMLRKQIESEKSMTEKKQEALSEFMSSIGKDMKKLYIELTELQTKRMQLIYSQLKKFGCAFKEFNHGYKKRKTEIGEMIGSFESICIEEIIERVKQEIEARANTRKKGHIFELQEMFTPMKNNIEQRKDATLSACALPKQEKFNNTHAVQSMIGRTQTTVDSSESDNLLVGTFCASSSESIKNKGMNPVRCQRSENSDSSLESKIETIVIPNEPSDCKMPPPFPTKEFCVSSGDEASACMEEQHEADEVSWKWSNTNQRLHTNNTDDISMIRNVKVIAIHDFVAGKGDQISFKKGQIIKQKVGENEDGFAYGWVRENRLAPKQYGWYPAGIVKRYVPSSDSARKE